MFPECGQGNDFLRDIAVDQSTGKVLEEFPCPHCASLLTKRRIESFKTKRFDASVNSTITQDKITPTEIFYSVGGGRIEKSLDEFDQALLNKIEELGTTNWFPASRMPEGDESRRNDQSGITHVHHFYVIRALIILSALLDKSRTTLPFRQMAICHFLFEQWAIGFSKLNRYSPHHYSQNNRNLSGTLYIGSQLSEVSPGYALEGKLRRLANAFADFRPSAPFILGTGSTTIAAAGPASLDYIFVDPPFGGNLPYSALNFFWESWLRVITNNEKEATTNTQLGRELPFYQNLMEVCFRQCWSMLKPGRWMTIEFSNTQASVWNAIQTTLQEAGFVVANVSALDKQSGSFKAVTTTTAVKQDLVISAYKPNGGLEDRFATLGGTEEGVWDFMRTHLNNLPVVKTKGGQLEFVTERDPRILYDRMVAFYFGHSTAVPLSSAEFQAGLEQHFSTRDGMAFLPEQATDYDRAKLLSNGLGQRSLLVDDERSAIDWLTEFLKLRPSESSDIVPHFMEQLRGSTWKKGEIKPELRELLRLNFLNYEGAGDVPSQIHSYLSTNFRECRNLAKNDPVLQAKAKDRWYVPDPSRAIDLEKLRERDLLRDFESYSSTSDRKIKEFRIEALRAGFKKAWQDRNYDIIIAVAAKIPEIVIQEDPKLLMWHSNAITRAGVD